MNSTQLFAAEHGVGPFIDTVDVALELGAYEELWTYPNASFKTIATKFSESDNSRPSHFVPEESARTTGLKVIQKLSERLQGWFGLRLQGDLDYPSKLRDATHPVELLYFQGYWDLLSAQSVAVVGTRNPSENGKKRAQKLVKALVEDNFTIVSGLAEGIDTEAHKTAITNGGRTIAVIGTPLGNVYPKSNVTLQQIIAKHFLLISQVPVERYDMQQNPLANRFFFPERNKTMSALTKATIIIEAGETSGTLVQAREALRQNRKVFILNSCFENPNLTWPEKFEAEGAFRVRDYDDIRRKLVV